MIDAAILVETPASSSREHARENRVGDCCFTTDTYLSLPPLRDTNRRCRGLHRPLSMAGSMPVK